MSSLWAELHRLTAVSDAAALRTLLQHLVAANEAMEREEEEEGKKEGGGLGGRVYDISALLNRRNAQKYSLVS